ncbi:MAG TPA: hypothetical protein VMA13_00145, partial [Candidatus Saccharimonadales bacterium]|nr:hypothetical protein [Candidatus Saccharimonadales bacterium]
ELRGREGFNLRVVVVGKHKNCREKEEDEGFPDGRDDATKEPLPAFSAHSPLPVNLNPFIYFA